MTMRYRCYGRDDFGHPYEALSTEDLDGDWVRFEDYELLRASRDMWETAAKNIGLESFAYAAALRKLRNEVGGLDICKHAIIETVSLTNWECLMLRVREADALLTINADAGIREELRVGSQPPTPLDVCSESETPRREGYGIPPPDAFASETNCNQADAAPSDAALIAPTPRGSLPNSLGDCPRCRELEMALQAKVLFVTPSDRGEKS